MTTPSRCSVVVWLCFALVGCANEGDAVVRVERWAHEGREVALPAHLPSTAGTIVLERTIDVPVPPDQSTLVLSFAELEAPARLTADGLVAPALDAQSGYRHIGPARFRIPRAALEDGRVDLALTVDDTWTHAGWLDCVPVLVDEHVQAHDAVRSHLLHGVMAISGALALQQVALTCLFVYFLDRKRRPYLWFGLQALAASIYCLFVAGLLHPFVGALDTTIVALSLIGALVVSVYFTRTFFELSTPSRMWLGSLLVAVLIAMCAIGPHVAAPIVGPVVILFGVVVIPYQLATCCWLVARHHDRTSAVLLLASWLALATTSWVDFARWGGIVWDFQGVHLGALGLTVFAFCLSLLLSRSHLLSMHRSDALNDELASRVKELETQTGEIRALNDELRRQIGERSEQLVSAFSLSRDARRVADLVPGELVQGRYRVEREVGSGGMGVVWEVTRIADGRRFALKRTLELDGTALARLAREASIASRVDHPNVVRILDVDIASAGYLYLVMELAPGRSLAETKERFGDIPFALSVLRQIAEGLGALHDAGIVHRDLKPANVLVDTAGPEPRVWITDFGISRARTLSSAPPPAPERSEGLTEETLRLKRASTGSKRGQDRLTETGHLPGTPLYMAPELASGSEHVNAAADMFAFGVLARELLVRHRPFASSVALGVLDGLPFPEIEPLRARWPDAPPVLASLLDRCLAASPSERPTALELVDELSIPPPSARAATG